MYTEVNINQEMGEEPLTELIERLTRIKNSFVTDGANPNKIMAIINNEYITIEAQLPDAKFESTPTKIHSNKNDSELSNLPEPTLPDVEGGKYVDSTYSVDVSGDVDYCSFVNIVEEYAKKHWDHNCFPRMKIRTVESKVPFFKHGVWIDVTGYRKETEEETKAREQKEHENMMSIAKKIEEKEKRQERLRYLSMMNPFGNQEGWEYASDVIDLGDGYTYLLKVRNGEYHVATFEDGVWRDEWDSKLKITDDSICKLISFKG